MFDPIIADPFSFKWNGKFYKISHNGIDWEKGAVYVNAEDVMTGETKILVIPDPEYHKKSITDLYEAGSFEQEVLSEFMFLSLEKCYALKRKRRSKNKGGGKRVYRLDGA